MINQPIGYASLCSCGWLEDSRVVSAAHLFVLSVDAQAGLEPVYANFNVYKIVKFKEPYPYGFNPSTQMREGVMQEDH
jgi:hypothetical protein